MRLLKKLKMSLLLRAKFYSNFRLQILLQEKSLTPS